MAAQSIQSFIGDLKAYKKNVLETRENAEIAALTELNELIQERVFNRHIGTEGQSFGTYRSESYKKKRLNYVTPKGTKSPRQIAFKDLELSGTFRKSIKVGKNQGRNVLGLDNEEGIKIREYQETSSKQLNFEFLKPTENEIDLAFKLYERVIFKKLDEIANV